MQIQHFVYISFADAHGDAFQYVHVQACTLILQIFKLIWTPQKFPTEDVTVVHNFLHGTMTVILY